MPDQLRTHTVQDCSDCVGLKVQRDSFGARYGAHLHHLDGCLLPAIYTSTTGGLEEKATTPALPAHPLKAQQGCIHPDAGAPLPNSVCVTRGHT